VQSENKEFLLEVGTEEIPAGMIEAGLADLKRLLEEGITRSRLSEGAPVSLEMHATPRRLVAYCSNLMARQPDSAELIQGPPKKVAFDAAGKPTAAALSFAAKMGTKPEKLDIVTTPKGEYVAFRKKERGKPTWEILRGLIPQTVLGIGFPRSMYWEGKSGPRFIRPIRSLLALYGGRLVPCSLGEVHAARSTFGHRRLGKSKLAVSDFASYQSVLRQNFVLLDAGERRSRILEGIQTLLSSENGFRIKENEELLNTLVYLTEYPTALLGSFDESYLSLPQEVLTTVMRGHQKYFSLQQKDGALAPRFVAVMNLDTDSSGAIRHGNERVLRARFNDARFFWETDGKTPLDQRLQLLGSVTFQAKLGTYSDKALRMEILAAELANHLNLPKEQAREVGTAALYAKCDLTTELVKEFTELQGVVGGLYAKRDSLSDEISTAIYDHYKPQSMEDAVPRTLAGAIVSLADRADTLVGCFGVGLAPTGSKDPFALRRSAQGLIRILVEHKLRLSLGEIIERSIATYKAAQARGQVASWGRAEDLEQLHTFFDDRISYYAREVRGFPYDEVNAVLTAEPEDMVDFFNRLEALSRVRKTENFEPVAAAFKRIKNILQQAQKTQALSGGELNPELLEAGPEAELFARYQTIRENVRLYKQAGNYFAALEAIASLRPHVDLFFDKVLVMAPDSNVRQNRLTLVSKLLTEFSTIADFSEIVVAEEKKQKVGTA